MAGLVSTGASRPVVQRSGEAGTARFAQHRHGWLRDGRLGLAVMGRESVGQDRQPGFGQSCNGMASWVGRGRHGPNCSVVNWCALVWQAWLRRLCWGEERSDTAAGDRIGSHRSGQDWYGRLGLFGTGVLGHGPPGLGPPGSSCRIAARTGRHGAECAGEEWRECSGLAGVVRWAWVGPDLGRQPSKGRSRRDQKGQAGSWNGRLGSSVIGQNRDATASFGGAGEAWMAR